MPASVLHRLSAFTTTPDGGNPAGVWVGEVLPDAASMPRITSDVGYSETASMHSAPPGVGGPGGAEQ
jgi:predicted PhzF superfamily epimerase YddE/YHI9